MGRFSSVQSFADNHNAVRKVAYEQVAASAATNPSASSATTGSSTAFIPPEKVVNPYGSTAGAGSGEFHIYRHSRNRELQRQKHMELSANEQVLEEQYQNELQQNQQWEDDRTAKRQKKRQRQKNAKQRKINLIKAGIQLGVTTTNDDEDDDDDEFQYTPQIEEPSLVHQNVAPESKDETTATRTTGTNADKTKNNNASHPTKKSVVSAKIVSKENAVDIKIPKDGSFMETMKQLLQPKEAQKEQQK